MAVKNAETAAAAIFEWNTRTPRLSAASGFLLHGTPVIAPFGVLDDESRPPGDGGESQREIVVGQLAALELEIDPVVAHHRDLDAERGSRPAPVEEQDETDLGDHDGDDVHEAENQGEARRDQRINEAHEKAADHDLGDQLGVQHGGAGSSYLFMGQATSATANSAGKI